MVFMIVFVISSGVIHLRFGFYAVVITIRALKKAASKQAGSCDIISHGNNHNTRKYSNGR